ncbi:MAG: ParB/Srx family N-terminal domain-containing protein [Hyphomonadaceae bacterium]|nr:ParB/Srx family N-terminal domain-containing protein [Hyphomonadaceae bacterium]
MTEAIASAPSPELRAIDALLPYARNSRTHSEEQLAELAGSLDQFGMVGAIVVRDGVIAKGHGTLGGIRRLLATGQKLYPAPGRHAGAKPYPDGMVPVLDVSGWSEAQFKAYVIADNQLALNAGWDAELLQVEMGELKQLGFELKLIGFSDEDLKLIEAGKFGAEDDEGSGLSENYSRKIEAPIYQITGEKPAVSDLMDGSKCAELQAEIDATPDLPPDVRAFLLAAAERHTIFNFRNIAEFYAHADAKTQRLMEKSALVIIDFDAAIENGFVKLSEAMMEQAGSLTVREAEREQEKAARSA